LKTPRKAALDTLQKLARLKAADDNGYCTCVSCGKRFHWKDMDGGHFIPKGHSSYWALKEVNVNPQCKGCNGFGMRYGIASQNYTLWMIDKHGREFIDDMEFMSNASIKFYKKDYIKMTKEWNEEIKKHLKRIGEAA